MSELTEKEKILLLMDNVKSRIESLDDVSFDAELKNDVQPVFGFGEKTAIGFVTYGFTFSINVIHSPIHSLSETNIGEEDEKK